jgi:hypothetical protein
MGQHCRRLWAYLGTYSAQIQGIGALATAIGVALAVLALLFTKCQVDLARRTLEATTVYSIQRDARDLLSNLQSDREVYDYLGNSDPSKAYPAEVIGRAQLKLHLIFQFYSSVFNQHQEGVLPEPIWNVFADEICAFLQKEPVAKFWRDHVDNGKFDKAFIAFGDACLQNVQSTKGPIK